MKLILWTFVFALISSFSQYDPHSPYSSPFFEGWYTRVTSSGSGPIQSIGIIFGSYPKPPKHLNGSNAIVNLFYKSSESDFITSVVVKLDSLDIRPLTCESTISIASPCFTVLFHPDHQINGSIMISSNKHIYDLSFYSQETSKTYSFYAEMDHHQHWGTYFRYIAYFE